MIFHELEKKHKKLSVILKKEIERQQSTINLIASENYVSPAILEALGTPFVNKYSEGYLGKRYYPGNVFIDKIEQSAIKSAKKLFRLGDDWHVNVQCYSGSPANAEIYMALMNFGDTLMGMNLFSGGHLTHGHPVTFSGKAYKTVQYGIDQTTGRIRYNDVEELAKKAKPQVIVSGYSAYPRAIDFKRFGEIAKNIGAYHVADISHIAGLIAAGLHPSPFPYADVVMTTTHKTLRGPRGAVIFCKKELAEKIDRAIFPGFQGGPHNNITFAKAIMFEEAIQPSFKKYQMQVIKNAKTLAAELQKYGFTIVSGGTDTHLLLVDLRDKNVSGREAEEKLELAGITANRNSLSWDSKPFYPSGIRLGTPAVTTRGMKEREMKKIALFIYNVLIKKSIRATHKEVTDLCKKFLIR